MIVLYLRWIKEKLSQQKSFAAQLFHNGGFFVWIGEN